MQPLPSGFFLRRDLPRLYFFARDERLAYFRFERLDFRYLPAIEFYLHLKCMTPAMTFFV